MRYLAYGSNLHPERLAERIGSFRTLEAIRLDGWKLNFCKRGADGSGKCTLVRSPSQHAYGVIYELPTVARAMLDEIEGVGHGYLGHWLELPNHPESYVYLAEDRYVDNTLQPYAWYKTLVVTGARHHRLPAAYIATLDATVAIADADQARADRNLSVLN
jgi:gamma-glutamylcyclotransferase